MKVTPRADLIRVISYFVTDGQEIISVDCEDFTEYKSLPHVVEFEGQILGKTGWNSDKNQAYYKSNILLARKV